MLLCLLLMTKQTESGKQSRAKGQSLEQSQGHVRNRISSERSFHNGIQQGLRRQRRDKRLFEHIIFFPCQCCVAVQLCELVKKVETKRKTTT